MNKGQNSLKNKEDKNEISKPKIPLSDEDLKKAVEIQNFVIKHGDEEGDDYNPEKLNKYFPENLPLYLAYYLNVADFYTTTPKAALPAKFELSDLSAYVFSRMLADSYFKILDIDAIYPDFFPKIVSALTNSEISAQSGNRDIFLDVLTNSAKECLASEGEEHLLIKYDLIPDLITAAEKEVAQPKWSARLLFPITQTIDEIVKSGGDGSEDDDEGGDDGDGDDDDDGDGEDDDEGDENTGAGAGAGAGSKSLKKKRGKNAGRGGGGGLGKAKEKKGGVLTQFAVRIGEIGGGIDRLKKLAAKGNDQAQKLVQFVEKKLKASVGGGTKRFKDE